MNRTSVDRRHFLRAAGGIALGTAAAPLLEACSSSDGDQDTGNSSGPSTTPGSSVAATSGTETTASSGGSAKSILPTYAPRDLVTFDFPRTDTGVPAAAVAYPASPVKVSDASPASGGSISMLKMAVGTPPAVGSNPFWQELNKRVGAEMQFINVDNSDYWAKVATTVAGGDLPDLMQLSAISAVPSHMSELLKAKFQDLSQWLSGDAVKDYPNLAALSQAAWKTTVFNGGIYGIPWPLSVLGNDNKVRQDIVDELGLSTELANGQDFLDLCKGLTDPKKHRWAIDTIAHASLWVEQMVGAPNSWKVESGKFTSAYATDEYKQAIDIVKQMWAAGYIEPDSVSSAASARAWFLGGTVALMGGGYDRGVLYTEGLAQDPKFAMSQLILPKWDGGGQAAHYEIQGGWTFTALKKASPSRVQELLKVADWFATPFGSEEYLFLNYGLPNRHYTLKGADPVETQTGMTECQSLRATYLATAPLVYYFPGHPDVVKAEYEGFVDLMKVSLPFPTAGLVSQTFQDKAAVINKNINSVQQDIIMDRKPLSAWDGAVKDWLAGGGAQMGHEYEQAYTTFHS
jgi:putative aldouronate transport system substrate-binding protein